MIIKGNQDQECDWVSSNPVYKSNLKGFQFIYVNIEVGFENFISSRVWHECLQRGPSCYSFPLEPF